MGIKRLFKVSKTDQGFGKQKENALLCIIRRNKKDSTATVIVVQ